MKQVGSHAPGGFDVICGSDITYREDLLDSLLLTARKLLKPGGRVFLTMQDRTNEARNFQHACIRGGWRVVSKNSVTPPSLKELKHAAIEQGQEKWGLVPPHIDLIWQYEIAIRDENATDSKPEKDPILSKTNKDHAKTRNERSKELCEHRQAQIVKGFLEHNMGELLCEQDERLAKFIAEMSYPPQTEEDRQKMAAAFFDDEGYVRATPPSLSFDDETSLLRKKCAALMGPEIEIGDPSGETRKSPKAGKSPKADERKNSPKAGDTAEEAAMELAEAKLCADGVEWDVTMLSSELQVSVTFTYEAWLKLGGTNADNVSFRDAIDFEIAEDALRVKHTDTMVLDLRLVHRVDSDSATAKLSSKNRRVVVRAPLHKN
jgi:hypothetical protein